MCGTRCSTSHLSGSSWREWCVDPYSRSRRQSNKEFAEKGFFFRPFTCFRPRVPPLALLLVLLLWARVRVSLEMSSSL